MSTNFLPDSFKSKSVLAKFFSVILFANLERLYFQFISWITKYYPFSLLYRDRLFHHDNLIIKNFMIKIENFAKKAGVKILIMDGNREAVMTEFVGYLDRKIKNRSKAIKTLETALQKKYMPIYVRDEGEKVRIIIPTEAFDELIYK